MNKRKKFGFATAAAGLALMVGGIIAPTTASAIVGDPVLTMNGTQYTGNNPGGSSTWQFSTPGNLAANQITATVVGSDRNQTWNGVQGANNLPCPAGIFWVSTSTQLTISHCLTAPPTEPTVPPTEPTVPPTEPTVPPTEPTVPPTDAPTTSVDSEAPTTTVAETTTTIVGSEGPTTTALSESGGPTTTSISPAPGLPRTGGSQNALIVLGLIMILGGLVFIALTRRPDEA